MQWVASTLHTTSEHGVSSITTADAHTSAASSRLNWRPPADLNGLVRFARKKETGHHISNAVYLITVGINVPADKNDMQFPYSIIMLQIP